MIIQGNRPFLIWRNTVNLGKGGAFAENVCSRQSHTLTGFPEDEARTDTVEERLEEEEDEEGEGEDEVEGSREWARRDLPPLTNC